jgi:hypothetical protein
MEPTPAVALNKLPAAALGGDVGVAAPGSTADGFGYVGVWVVEAADCADIGTARAKNFAVITSSTFRDGPSAAYGNFSALKDGKGTLAAGGASGQRTIQVEQTTPDALTIDGKAYVRCSP